MGTEALPPLAGDEDVLCDHIRRYFLVIFLGRDFKVIENGLFRDVPVIQVAEFVHQRMPEIVQTVIPQCQTDDGLSIQQKDRAIQIGAPQMRHGDHADALFP